MRTLPDAVRVFGFLVVGDAIGKQGEFVVVDFDMTTRGHRFVLAVVHQFVGLELIGWFLSIFANGEPGKASSAICRRGQVTGANADERHSDT